MIAYMSCSNLLCGQHEVNLINLKQLCVHFCSAWRKERLAVKSPQTGHIRPKLAFTGDKNTMTAVRATDWRTVDGFTLPLSCYQRESPVPKEGTPSS